MKQIFFKATEFNGDVSDWNVSSVTNMNFMFKKASAFNQTMCGWTVVGNDMFDGSLCTVEACIGCTTVLPSTVPSGLPSVVPSSRPCPDGIIVVDANITNITVLFVNSLNEEAIKCLDTSLVTTMDNLFAKSDVNADLNSWDVSSVTNMNGMLNQATKFNGNVSDWNVSSVTYMSSMFKEATRFNGNVSDWNVSSVTYMNSMFNEATRFNGNVSD